MFEVCGMEFRNTKLEASLVALDVVMSEMRCSCENFNKLHSLCVSMCERVCSWDSNIDCDQISFEPSIDGSGIYVTLESHTIKLMASGYYDVKFVFDNASDVQVLPSGDMATIRILFK